MIFLAYGEAFSLDSGLLMGDPFYIDAKVGIFINVPGLDKLNN